MAFAEAVSQSQNLEEIYVCGETINLSKFRSDTVIVLKEESVLKNEKKSLNEDFAIISRCIAQNKNLKKIGFRSMIKLNAKVEKLILSELLNIVRQCDRLEHIQLQSTYLSISHVITLLKAILDARKDKGNTKDLHFEWDDTVLYI